LPDLNGDGEPNIPDITAVAIDSGETFD